MMVPYHAHTREDRVVDQQNRRLIYQTAWLWNGEQVGVERGGEEGKR